MSPKETLRGEIKKRLNCFSVEEFNSQGKRAAVFLRNSSVWSGYSTIFLFLSLNTEIDTGPLLETAFMEGKKVFAPMTGAVTGPGNIKPGDKMVFYPLRSARGPWHTGSLGIREPGDTGPVDNRNIPAGACDYPALILVPGLAFDREGNRLGRGRGYYDRFLAELDEEGREYIALGLCMDFQVVDRVPAGEEDKKVHGILTGAGLYITGTKIPQ